MKRRVLKRPRAFQDAESIADWIAQHDLAAAVQFLENLESTLHVLSSFPERSIRYFSRNPTVDELRFTRVNGFANYLVFFEVTQETICVVRILHGARDLETALTEDA